MSMVPLIWGEDKNIEISLTLREKKTKMIFIWKIAQGGFGPRLLLYGERRKK